MKRNLKQKIPKAVRDDGFEQLFDGVPTILKSNEIFRFKCCDCGLVHKMVIGTSKKQKIALVVEREK